MILRMRYEELVAMMAGYRYGFLAVQARKRGHDDMADLMMLAGKILNNP